MRFVTRIGNVIPDVQFDRRIDRPDQRPAAGNNNMLDRIGIMRM
nr:MAG TPA_asm: hypothetical protein [Caudoviricetes sp.]